jgi:hypothetical protein
VKDVTTFPDQDIIRNDIACTTYPTKLDMSEANEQIRVGPAHVSKTVFATILGTCKGNLGRSSTLKQCTGEAGSKFNIQN